MVQQDTFGKAYSVGRWGRFEEQVLELVRAWNTHLPKNHVLILSDARFREAAHTLECAGKAGVEIGEVLAAIKVYGNAEWQRANGFKTFDNWIMWNNVIIWIERAEEQRSRNANRDRLRAVRVREARERAHQSDDWMRLSRGFDALSRDERVQWMQLADDRHRRMNGGQPLPRDQQRTEAVKLWGQRDQEQAC